MHMTRMITLLHVGCSGQTCAPGTSPESGTWPSLYGCLEEAMVGSHDSRLSNGKKKAVKVDLPYSFQFGTSFQDCLDPSVSFLCLQVKGERTISLSDLNHGLSDSR